MNALIGPTASSFRMGTTGLSDDHVASTALAGQWVGTLGGPRRGLITLDIEADENGWVGQVVRVESDTPVPACVCRVRVTAAASKLWFSVEEISTLDWPAAVPVAWAAIQNRFPVGTLAPAMTELTGTVIEEELTLEWVFENGDAGTAALVRRNLTRLSELPVEKLTWKQFKDSIGGAQWKNELFRGQAAPWRLQTSFHRRGRTLFPRFVREDMKEAHLHVAGATNQRFDLGPGDDLVLLSLMQHHGYPTPILDWTRSPYIAAFFAYRQVSLSDLTNESVRIFAFDQETWKKLGQKPQLAALAPHVSLLDLLPLANARMLPQQAVSMLTNVADIEHYIMLLGRRDKETYLRAVDLPSDQRSEVLRDLRFMGITAASLFPGLDGLFEDLRERRFDR